MGKSEKLEMENSVDEQETKDKIAPADEGVDDEENPNVFKLRKPIPNGGELSQKYTLILTKSRGATYSQSSGN